MSVKEVRYTMCEVHASAGWEVHTSNRWEVEPQMREVHGTRGGRMQRRSTLEGQGPRNRSRARGLRSKGHAR